MRPEFTGLFGFILFGLDLWAIISVIGSREGTGTKVLWVLGILILPFIGFIVWFFAGPRASRG